MYMEEAYKRDFKGVWIPKEIWLNKDLSLQEKVFLVEINSLDNEDGCFANNEYFARFFGLSKDRASDIISGLIKKDYLIIQLNKDADNRERRVLHVRGMVEKYDTVSLKSTRGSERKQLHRIVENNEDNNIYNNTDNNTNKIVTTLQQPKAVIAKEDKRNPDIQEVYEYGLSKGFVGIKQAYQRYAIKRLLGKIEKNKLLRLVDFTQQIRKDQYAPQVNTFLDMEYKLANLRDYMARKQTKQKTIVKI